MQRLELWGGLECTVARIGNEYRDQIRETGHFDHAVAGRAASLYIAAPTIVETIDVTRCIAPTFIQSAVEKKPSGMNCAGPVTEKAIHITKPASAAAAGPGFQHTRNIT